MENIHFLGPRESARLQPVQPTGAQTAQSLQGKGLCLLSDLEATNCGQP